MHPTSPEAVTPLAGLTEAKLDRRGLFRAGGLTVTLAALLAACGEKVNELGRVGEAPTTTAMPTATVNDATLARTASSIEHSLVDLYAKLSKDSKLLPADYVPILEFFSNDHQSAAAEFEKAATSAGGEAWTCSNPRLDSTVINPVLARITDGVKESRDGVAVPPSDDPHRDVVNLVHSLETMCAAMYQQLVETLSDRELRGLAIDKGILSARRAALVALKSNPARPDGYISAAAAAPGTTPQAATTTTAAPPADGAEQGPQAMEIPVVSAIPSRFGQIAAQFLVVGAGDENGVRMRVSVETPSLNTFVYDYMEPSC